MMYLCGGLRIKYRCISNFRIRFKEENSIVADAGYFSGENLRYAYEEKIDAFIPFNRLDESDGQGNRTAINIGKLAT